MSKLHQDSLAAWTDFQRRGGIELHGRDEGLDEELKNRLKPSARSLEDALRSTTTDEFVNAFFNLLQPFAEMFRSILKFFEKAAATEGREQWNITVDNIDFKLNDFRRFLKKWDNVPCEFEVPAVDFHGAWLAGHAIDGIPEMQVIFSHEKPYLSGVSDIDRWLRAYRSGTYEELPPSLEPSQLGPGYADAAALARAALKIIRERYTSREEFIAEHRARGFRMDRADALSPRTIAQNETDYWLRSLVSILAHSRSLPKEVQGQLGNRLKDGFAAYSRKKFNATTRVSDLQTYLSLPIWQKRHELYAVWIATEIISALPEHRCEIHSENGKIVFAFRETVVATIESSSPPVRLISERRVPLDAPIGKGRSNNVQPDYGLWRKERGMEKCGLIVEVKHYKRSAPASFGDVLVDYARAFPGGEIYLVNHGPVSYRTASNVSHEIHRRCHTIEHLTAFNWSAREKLHKAVRDYVGEPVVRGVENRNSELGNTVFAVDVSASMRSHLSGLTFSKIVERVSHEQCSTAALIDVEIRTLVPLKELSSAIEITADGSSTNLGEPIRQLLTTFNRVVVVTDDEGADTLPSLSKRKIIQREAGLVVLEVFPE